MTVRSPRYVLTGRRRACHEDQELLYWHITDPSEQRDVQQHFSNYEQFQLFRITDGIYRQLQCRGIAWRPSLNDFAVLLKYCQLGYAVICKEKEALFAQAGKWIGERKNSPIRSQFRPLATSQQSIRFNL